MLCEGSSMRAIARVNDVPFETVKRQLVTAGETALALHNRLVNNLDVDHVQCDEIWAFCYAKNKTVKRRKEQGEPIQGHDWTGDLWTWTAVDRDTKLLISWVTGTREEHYALRLAYNVNSRINGEFKLTTDGHRPYEEAFGRTTADPDDLDYVQVVKIYDDNGRYVGSEKKRLFGDGVDDEHNTSIAESFNQSIRTDNRRMVRKTVAHSKKALHHNYQLALYFLFRNFIRPHGTLTRRNKNRPTTPAMAAGLAEQPFTWEAFLQACDSRNAPGSRGPYKKHSRPNARANNARKRMARERAARPTRVFRNGVRPTDSSEVTRVIR